MEKLIALAIASAVVVSAQQAPAASPRELFERARVIEESNQNLAQAIALYTQAAATAAANSQRDLAGMAHWRAGLLYERLGRKDDARRAFRIVATDYADQADLARQAQLKLAAASAATPGAPATRQVWAGLGVGPFGAPSRDGRLLSYVDWITGDLRVRDLATGALRHVTKGAMDQGRFTEFSVFSHDGRQLAFGTFNFAGPVGYELRIAGSDGSNVRTLYSHPETTSIRPFAWTPDARQILTSLARKDGTTQLAFIAVDTGAARILKTFDWRGVANASLSSDGAWIAYDFPPDATTPSRDIFLLAADGSRQATLDDHAANDLFPIWTPDGRHVLFLSDRSGTMGLWSQSVSGGRPVGSSRLVRADMTAAAPLGVTETGNLYYHQAPQTDIYVAGIDPDTGELAQPASRFSEHLVGANTAPDWSPDGRQLVYVSRRLDFPRAQPIGARILCVVDVESARVRELKPALSAIDRPQWSPDGRSLLVQAQENARYGLYRIDAATGSTTRLLQLDPGFGLNGALWSRDGTAILYITYGLGAAGSMGAPVAQPVIRFDLTSGATRVIDDSTGPKSDLALSRDGRWLAYRAMAATPAGASRMAAAIRLIPVEGGPPRDLTTGGVGQIAAYRGLNWSRDDRFLIFAIAQQKEGGPLYSLARVLVAGGPAQPIAAGLTSPDLLGATLDLDGRRLAFRSVAGSLTGEIWVMENFLR
ncbi:MAG: hypothetical protein WD690_10980 [Vicinamibacterales bacterium]